MLLHKDSVPHTMIVCIQPFAKGDLSRIDTVSKSSGVHRNISRWSNAAGMRSRQG